MLSSVGLTAGGRDVRLRLVSSFIVSSSLSVGGSSIVKLAHLEASHRTNGSGRKKIATVERPVVVLQAGRTDANSGEFVEELASLTLGSDAVSSVSFEADSNALIYELMVPSAPNGLLNVTLQLHDPASSSAPSWGESARAIAVRYQQVRTRKRET